MLWLIRGLGPGGAETLLLNAARASNRTCDYEIAHTRPDKQELVGDLETAGVPVRLLGSRWAPSLATLVRSGRYDIVHSHAPLMAAVTRTALRVPSPRTRPLHVTTEHNLWAAYGPTTRRLNAVGFGADSHHFAVSEAVRASMPARWQARTEVLIHGVDPRSVQRHEADREATRRELGIAPSTILVGTVANYRVHKAWPDLLEAADTVTSSNPNVRFVGVGQGPLEELVAARHRSLGLDQRFQLLGYRPDAARYIAAMDVFVMSSIQEGLPVALMEALVLGKPVVATCVGGIPEAIDSGVEGLLVEPGAPKRLADAILGICASGARLDEFSRAARERGKAFTIERAVDTIESRYAALLASAG